MQKKINQVQAWIYLIDSNGIIVNQVKVSWPKVRDIYYEAKEKAGRPLVFQNEVKKE